MCGHASDVEMTALIGAPPSRCRASSIALTE
jgi:hypothetical protein